MFQVKVGYLKQYGIFSDGQTVTFHPKGTVLNSGQFFLFWNLFKMDLSSNNNPNFMLTVSQSP